MKRQWMIQADSRLPTGRIDSLWWMVDRRYPEGAWSSNKIGAMVFDSLAEARRRAVMVAIETSHWHRAKERVRVKVVMA